MKTIREICMYSTESLRPNWAINTVITHLEDREEELLAAEREH